MLSATLPAILALFIHVLYRGLVDHQIGGAAAVHLQAGFVVPLDGSADLLAITQHDHHRSLRLHLFLIIKVLRIGLFRRRRLFARAIRSVMTVTLASLQPVAALSRSWGHVVVLGPAQRRPYQFAIGKALGLQRPVCD